jgi:hypothetical protein
MRLRRAFVMVLGTGMLVLATSAVANAAPAANGKFWYLFVDSQGIHQISTLIDPPSRDCIDLTEVANPRTSTPAYAPYNDTDATAVVYTKPGCKGDFHVLNPRKGASHLVKLRSVLFS